MENTIPGSQGARILGFGRILGILFASTLVGVIGIAMVPNHFFIVSQRAIVNAPVEVIAAPIYGRVNSIDLQVGQSVTKGDEAAALSNPNLDQTSITGLNLERLNITERLNGRRDTLEQRRRQFASLEEQIARAREGVMGEMNAVIENAAVNVQIFEARMNEQDALLERQRDLVRRGIVSEMALLPLEQKRNAAAFEFDAANVEVRRQELLRDLVQKGTYTSGSAVNELATLETQRKALQASINEDTIAVQQLEDRARDLETLIASEQGRMGGSEAAMAMVRYDGQIVSVDASIGEFLAQGQPLARSLDCSKSFVAAVYPAREVARIPLGTPALVNIRSIDEKRVGKVIRVVRFLDTGSNNRYFHAFPKAKGDEVFVLVQLDAAETSAVEEGGDGKFFGCNVGDEVIVSLGEPVMTKLIRTYDDVLVPFGTKAAKVAVVTWNDTYDDILVPYSATMAETAATTWNDAYRDVIRPNAAAIMDATIATWNDTYEDILVPYSTTIRDAAVKTWNGLYDSVIEPGVTRIVNAALLIWNDGIKPLGRTVVAGLSEAYERFQFSAEARTSLPAGSDLGVRTADGHPQNSR